MMFFETPQLEPLVDGSWNGALVLPAESTISGSEPRPPIAKQPMERTFFHPGSSEIFSLIDST
jgi:hypothetical protein